MMSSGLGPEIMKAASQIVMALGFCDFQGSPLLAFVVGLDVGICICLKQQLQHLRT